MRSKAHLKGHSLHPILITFPVAFFIGTVAFDILAITNNNGGFWKTGMYLEMAGLLTGLLAAVPGLIDYIYTVPPKSSAKERARKHGFINAGVLLIFSFALLLRGKDFSIVIAALEFIGVLWLSIAGWMGGTLVSRNQIGVDIRYAGAGKWKEQYYKGSGKMLEVALIEELKIDQMKLLHINSKRIVLGRTEKGYVAFDDRCTHKGGSLAGGVMICGTVQCPWHGAQYDLGSGLVKAGPAKEKINLYNIVERDGKVFLNI